MPLRSFRFASFERLRAATQAYSRDLGTNRNTVSLGDLVSGGYLGVDGIGVLLVRETTIALDGSESRPSAVLIRVKLFTGRNDIALLNDGSICGLAITN